MSLPNSYYQGRKARLESRLKISPGHLDIQQSHWWLAGWNDCDIEIGPLAHADNED